MSFEQYEEYIIQEMFDKSSENYDNKYFILLYKPN